MGDRDGVTVRVRVLEHCAGVPEYQTDGASGLDLAAALDVGEEVSMEPGEIVLVPTGVELEIPPGYEGQVRPRSGLAARCGLTVLNAPGTVDADYRGEVEVLLINLGKFGVAITRGMRVAQLVIAPVARVDLVEVEVLGETVRGDGGMGSTGGMENDWD